MRSPEYLEAGLAFAARPIRRIVVPVDSYLIAAMPFQFKLVA